MAGFLIGTIILVAILLVLVVLAQNPKNSGSGLSFSGTSQLMGAKRSADFFEKLTWGFVAVIMVFSLMANVLIERPTAGEMFSSPNVEAAKDKSAVPPANIPTTLDSTTNIIEMPTETEAKGDSAQ